jgi:two-component system response regulator HydG
LQFNEPLSQVLPPPTHQDEPKHYAPSIPNHLAPVVVKGDLKSTALDAEYEMILSVLKQVKFNKTKAAEVLGIDRKTLYNKMKNINLDS